jgi:hypothetical protein
MLGNFGVDDSLKIRLQDTDLYCKPDTRIIYKDLSERLILLTPKRR